MLCQATWKLPFKMDHIHIDHPPFDCQGHAENGHLLIRPACSKVLKSDGGLGSEMLTLLQK